MEGKLNGNTGLRLCGALNHIIVEAESKRYREDKVSNVTTVIGSKRHEKMDTNWRRKRLTFPSALFVVLILLLQHIHGCLCSCDGKGRTILRDETGTISDGSGHYPEDTECQWLIEASNSSMFICLSFTKFATECTYDFLHIFDGDSFNSPMIGSFSGDKSPPPDLCAASGKMLLFLYSDTNYALDGFQVDYSVMECPQDCLNGGTCLDHGCICPPGYYGDACQYETCPSECVHGECNHNLARAKCLCHPGFIGESCNLSVDTNDGWGTTVLLSSGGDGGLASRTGHAAVYHEPTDSMWVFGGYDLNSPLGDLLKYDFQSNQWETVNTVGAPAGRYGHIMEVYNDEIIIFGGILSDDSFSNELWSFNIVSRQWSLLPSSLSVQPTAHHSSCIVNQTVLYIIGGRSSLGPFHHHIYRYDLEERSGWELVEPAGGLLDAIGVAEHSSVYHPGTQSIYVFGGLRESNPKFGIRTDDMYLFNIPRRFWQRLNVSGDVPRGRTFHTASLVGDQYMVVYGGNAHRHQGDGPNSEGYEECYEDTVYLYNFGCNSWFNYIQLADDFTDDNYEQYGDDVGRFGHSTIVRDGTTLVITGGFRGVVTNDVIAIKMPGTVALNPSSAGNVTAADYCSHHKSEQRCRGDPSCGYCTSTGGCINREKSQDCSNFQDTLSCPGICEQALTCHACLLLNPEVKGQCSWCVQTSRCFPSSDLKGCTSSLGWWGESPTVISDYNLCVAEDLPPGLTLARYFEPINREYPDEVRIIDVDNYEVDADSSRTGIWDARGTLYTLNVRGSKGADLRVSLKSKNADVQVWISGGSLNRSVNSSFQFNEARVEEVLRPDRFAHYELRVKGNWLSTSKSSLLGLSWNGNTTDSEAVPLHYLRPHTSGDCTIHWNCQSCLTDLSCGWSSTTQRCLRRNSSSEEILNINGMYCQDCTKYIECQTCLENPLCEWDGSKNALCSRRGSSEESVKELSMCPTHCYLRTSCRECTQQDNCAWCAEDQKCFPFKHYIKSYAYGQCSHWFDNPSHCSNCSLHTNCSSCLGEFQCGWCGNTANPLLGVCSEGDFNGLWKGGCSSLVAERHNLTEGSPSQWWYEMCPLIDECKVGLYDCHSNATCQDTYSSYECKCNRGFRGDGVKTCEKTCYHSCVHGQCSESPDYVCLCDLGWTGVNCTTDCGCNLHSTCSGGVGVCDECMNQTMGDHCDECEPASYGDPLHPSGCERCNCNGHGDPERGTCNASTQECYCLNNTAGSHCQECAHNFYGDPRGGNRCYLQCEGRTVRWNMTRLSLGSFEGDGISDPASTNCLWTLSSFENEVDAILAPVPGKILLTVDFINTTCGRDYVQVYDGVMEEFSGWSKSPTKLLGNFCGYGDVEPITVVALSGFVTISFQASLQGRTAHTGFTALFQSLDCTNGCGENSTCVDNRCVCNDSHYGPLCDQEICPSNCHRDSNQGSCDEATGTCSCSQSYGGADCSYRIDGTDLLHEAVWTPLYQQSNGVVPGRVGHTMFATSDGRLVVFGGYSEDGTFLNDMWSYDSNDGRWSEVTYTTTPPSGRYFHGSLYLSALNRLVVSGGLTEDGISGELWMFDTVRRNWTSVDMIFQDPEDSDIPRLAGHTLTEWQQNRAFLLGGFSPEMAFNMHLMEYNAVEDVWQNLDPKGTGPIGIYGHTATWHEESASLYVFGGYRFAGGQVWTSDVLYAYYQRSNTWFIQPPANMPLYHLFHSAVSTSRYLFVVGGGTSEKNFTNSVYTYQYDCNAWHEVKTTNDGPPSALGQTAVAMNGNLYVYGGFHGRSMGSLYSLTLPTDICRQYLDQDECLVAYGCTRCVLDDEFHSCSYRNSCDFFPVEGHSTSATVLNTSIAECRVAAIPSHSCIDFKTCGECLTTYPAHATVKLNCKWCFGCPQGTCIPEASDCLEYCVDNRHEEIRSINSCSELDCPVTDCVECGRRRGCMWTRQFQQIAETRYRLTKVPSFSWNCYSTKLREVSPDRIEVQTSPPNPCPESCESHLTCSQCLDSDGADGGWSSCVWSSQLQQCMSPSYLYLHCITGRCGLILYGNSALCPVACETITNCDSCLRQANCGWCSVGNTTKGICLSGNISSPAGAVCRNNTLTGSYIPEVLSNLAVSEEVMWHYLTCPPENECTNREDICSENQNCVDTYDSYVCVCKDGYTSDDDGNCLPACSRGCGHGVCLAPDTCSCELGYIGDACSSKCNCNGHSSCPGPESLDVCTDCLHNTTGRHCEYCSTFFVGNATNGGSCTPCSSICNLNSDMCISKHNDTNWQNQPGPAHEDDVKCLNCSNNSQGNLCESCQNGFFMKDGSCVQCECNGHSDSCDPITGTDCDCKNHTATPKCPSNNLEEPCYEYECSLCTEPEVFKGTPTNGHQCYWLVDTNDLRCFGANSGQSECTSDSVLPPGRSEVFVMKPGYVDLDIRVTIDVTSGSLDVYISHEHDMFVIRTVNGRHVVMIDGSKQVDRTDVVPQERRDRQRREAVTESSSSSSINRVTSHTATGLNSFVVINDAEFVTVIRQVENRLIVTIPHRVHKLNSKWFYFVLLATDGNWAERADTPGALIFRQDIPEIDLFIFFSAFLSSFFKLLAILIAIWKLKVSWEARQAARARTLEMEHRRSRPFGRVVIYMEEVADPLPVPPAHPSRRTAKRKSPRARRSGQSSSRSRHGPISPPPQTAASTNSEVPTSHEKLPFQPGAIALETTDDGMAAVGTVVVSLPGGSKAPLQACLGSGLMRHGKANTNSQGRSGKHSNSKQGNTRQSSGHTYRPV